MTQRGAGGAIALHTAAGERKYLDAAERALFLEQAMSLPLPVRALCLTLAYTGCRISEALDLTADAVRMAEGVIAIRSLKKRGPGVVVREVPVPDSLFVELGMLNDAGLVNQAGRLWPWGRGRAWQLVKQAMREAGVATGPHMTPKGLRHAFGLHAIRRGVPLNLVQRWLGHASLATTAIYLQATGPDERAIAARMWDGQP